MNEDEFRNGKKKKAKSSDRIAQKDFVLHQNEYHFDIKKGDDLDKLGVPEKFDENLTIEKVLKG